MSDVPDLSLYFRRVNGVLTRFYCVGEGAPVMLIHGAGVPAEIWLRNIQPLARRFRICAMDTLGSGFTESGPYISGPIHTHILQHLFALADDLGFRRFAVVGSSLGGLFATLMALNEPDRVSHLITVGAGSVFNNRDEYIATWKAVRANGGSAFDNPTFENCRARMSRLVRRMDELPEALLVMQMTCYALPGAAEMFARRTEGMLDPISIEKYRAVDRLEEIRVPFLAVNGAQDPRCKLGQVRENIGRIRGGRLEVIEDCGHYPQIEVAGRFNAVVSDFLMQ
jgi:2-hydroxy-6-oxonona-2,4-dienedioate hydrolase